VIGNNTEDPLAGYDVKFSGQVPYASTLAKILTRAKLSLDKGKFGRIVIKRGQWLKGSQTVIWVFRGDFMGLTCLLIMSLNLSTNAAVLGWNTKEQTLTLMLTNTSRFQIRR
jgi:hypothetical protein